MRNGSGNRAAPAETAAIIPAQRERDSTLKQVCGETEHGCGPVYTHDEAVLARTACRIALASGLIEERRRANGGDYDVEYNVPAGFCNLRRCLEMVGIEKSDIVRPLGGECREQQLHAQYISELSE